MGSDWQSGTPQLDELCQIDGQNFNRDRGFCTSLPVIAGVVFRDDKHPVTLIVHREPHLADKLHET